MTAPNYTARALIAEGLRHDEAMREPGFRFSCSCDPCSETREAVQTWLRTNASELLTGWAQALDEVERLKAELTRWKSPCVSVGSTPDGWVCPTCNDPKCGDA